ncbi:hypothetical protein [Pseudomonas sp. SM4]|uniref:hypothetical protein n=1 Tax=Pseudomonas sp. SM4 TaxID=3424177 RepID=UPI003F7AAB41
MVNEQIRKLFEDKERASGKFVASIDGEPFLVGTSFVFHGTSKEFIVVGNDNNKHWVAFAVPSSLQGGPHVVSLYNSWQTWEVLIDSQSHRVKSGSVTVTFNDDQLGVKGTVDFVLPDGRRVSGSFDISRSD